ncbi:MAG: polyprenyl synthetase family protein [bacterium]|nr:polyprenyl synthetase family protein [bacterium]
MNRGRDLIAREKAVIDAALVEVLPPVTAWPRRLHEAMAYAVQAGGKRLRPTLARCACAADGGDPDTVLPAVCGLELIHTYSLVHDDLPALDDDTLRRGRATVHVAFDEATAILVGDALLTEGLLCFSRYPEGDDWSERRIEATKVVAEAIGSRGMVGGQMEDLEATGQVEGTKATNSERLERIHRHKTGCLLRASVEVGAILAGTTESLRRTFVQFGEALGLAFQIADDILDATASAEELGKSPGKDEEAGKLTYVTLFGLETAREQLESLESEMLTLAGRIEGKDGDLAAIAGFVSQRKR